METLTSYQADCLSVIHPLSPSVGVLMPATRFRDFQITSARMTIRDCLWSPPSSCSPPTIPRRALIAISQPWVVPVRPDSNRKASRKLRSPFFVWIQMYWHSLSFSCTRNYPYVYICETKSCEISFNSPSTIVRWYQQMIFLWDNLAYNGSDSCIYITIRILENLALNLKINRTKDWLLIAEISSDNLVLLSDIADLFYVQIFSKRVHMLAFEARQLISQCISYQDASSMAASERVRVEVGLFLAA